MSDARVAAVVCEGHTDVPILREVIQAMWPAIDEVRALQPELDETGRAKAPGGWTQVRSWCEQNADRLEEILEPDVGDPIDLLVVAVDVDIAIEAEMADPPAQGAGGYETKRLRSTLGRWLGEPKRHLPPAIIISTPVMAIEAWVVAALFPKHPSPETVPDGAAWLVEKGKLRTSPTNGKPWNELHVYRDFGVRVARALAKVRKACPEAARTCRAIDDRRRMIEGTTAKPTRTQRAKKL